MLNNLSGFFLLLNPCYSNVDAGFCSLLDAADCLLLFGSCSIIIAAIINRYTILVKKNIAVLASTLNSSPRPLVCISSDSDQDIACSIVYNSTIILIVFIIIIVDIIIEVFAAKIYLINAFRICTTFTIFTIGLAAGPKTS